MSDNMEKKTMIPDENEAVFEEKEGKIFDNETLRKANRYFFAKVAINLCLIMIGALIIALCLRQIQTHSVLNKQKQNSELALAEVMKTIEENEKTAQTLTEIFHEANQDVLDDMCQLFRSGMFDSLSDADNETRSEAFADLVKRSGVQYLFLMADDGRVVLSPEPTLYGANLSVGAYMTQENINQLIKGTTASDGKIEPVHVKSHFGTFYFYSVPYEYQKRMYYLVLGIDDSVLDVQIRSLKDISVVLSRGAITNNGFIFAVDKKDGTFLYYKNGKEVLTGQNAVYMGLSKNALNDGYSGTEVINGTKYYCVTKQMGEQTLICAVAETGRINSRNSYVLFWTILGFVCIMMICLSYAVIVRNDFVRRSVKTDRVILTPGADNPFYFDKSVFKKIFPLMLAGVLLMFGISFYTQTLLEISEGIEKSRVALDEVSGRYEESLVNHDVIEKYYNDRFLAKAKLISFLIEEDPTALNEESNHYHAEFDKKGDKHFLKDDEGNRIRSIANSKRLQELCDANDIEAVYIFDEDGHTIGTNTPNWYFVLSQNEKDQSFPFRQILEGRLEHFIQEPMTNDIGEKSQIIGVTFNYYTKKNAKGETEYVSRFAYERDKPTAGADGKTKSGITAHTALLQIFLDAELYNRLLSSTEVGNILSTNMLSDGFIVLFDAENDHKCVYSPNESSIGKKAKEMGVSSRAFSGFDYFGFNRVNGIDYFQYFRYSDGYYVATALPRANMYQWRLVLALVTSIMCFLLILFLSGTVTVTSKEEEELYAAMSEAQAKKGLNSAIFNIVLPSGKNVSTVKAAARWDNRRIPWSEKSPEQKLLTMIGGVIGVLVVYVLITILGANHFFGENSIIRYVMSGSWDRGMNIFALSSCALVLMTIILGVELFRIPVRITTALLGARGETIGHLLLSVVKYGGALTGLFYCLYLLGIDSSKLLASAGILSLVIGFGAQSLIKDIIAGIFIVFEGEFRVGDIVTIGNYRGTVMDIGLRTTKIMGVDGNIKIYNNSEISGVLNMTQEASYAMCYISIEYGQDLEYVEEVLSRELPLLKTKNPKLLDVQLLGVQDLEDSGVKLSIMGTCNEADILSVRRYLNREVLQIFYLNGITVPFPNITFSALDPSDRLTLKDLVGDLPKREGTKKDQMPEKKDR